MRVPALRAAMEHRLGGGRADPLRHLGQPNLLQHSQFCVYTWALVSEEEAARAGVLSCTLEHALAARKQQRQQQRKQLRQQQQQQLRQQQQQQQQQGQRCTPGVVQELEQLQSCCKPAARAALLAHAWQQHQEQQQQQQQEQHQLDQHSESPLCEADAVRPETKAALLAAAKALPPYSDQHIWALEAEAEAEAAAAAAAAAAARAVAAVGGTGAGEAGGTAGAAAGAAAAVGHTALLRVPVYMGQTVRSLLERVGEQVKGPQLCGQVVRLGRGFGLRPFCWPVVEEAVEQELAVEWGCKPAHVLNIAEAAAALLFGSSVQEGGLNVAPCGAPAFYTMHQFVWYHLADEDWSAAAAVAAAAAAAAEAAAAAQGEAAAVARAGGEAGFYRWWRQQHQQQQQGAMRAMSGAGGWAGHQPECWDLRQQLERCAEAGLWAACDLGCAITLETATFGQFKRAVVLVLRCAHMLPHCSNLQTRASSGKAERRALRAARKGQGGCYGDAEGC